MARHARPGRVEAILLRPERRAAVLSVSGADILPDGLVGDHGREGKRAITLLQAEHLPVIAKLLDRESVLPDLLRRNIVVSRLNLLATRGRLVRLGDAVVEVTGPCPPCSRMEEYLGDGGYSAMRGHGGVYARVEKPGRVGVGSMVRLD